MKSTHSGHCQACGSLQKLPSGRLSLHGYKVTHGFFSGTCVGARFEPFEVSCELVKTFIESAQAQLASVEARQARLRQPATEARCMVHAYLGTRKSKSSYVWREVTLIPTALASRYEYDVTDWQGKTLRRTLEVGYDRSLTILDVATEQNAKFAKWLEHEADSLRRYIAWQEERVAGWKPAPLLPNDAKDKEGFTPTEAPY